MSEHVNKQVSILGSFIPFITDHESITSSNNIVIDTSFDSFEGTAVVFDEHTEPLVTYVRGYDIDVIFVKCSISHYL